MPMVIFMNGYKQRFEADHLTSKPINLDYSPSDNIMRFFLPGRRPWRPSPAKRYSGFSLCSEESVWHSVWKAEVPDTVIGFKPVIEN